jgi:hypothetical protein
MQVFDTKNYIESLTHHYENFFGVKGNRLILQKGPTQKLHKDFFVLEFPHNDKHKMFCYCTVGMSADKLDDNLVELIVYSPKPDNLLVELLTVCASYHRNGFPLNLSHTVNIGQPWLDNSKCDHGFISLPYLDGQELELFSFGKQDIHCYWFIPITEQEKEYKRKYGSEALEQLFDDKQFDYLNPNRDSLI